MILDLVNVHLQKKILVHVLVLKGEGSPFNRHLFLLDRIHLEQELLLEGLANGALHQLPLFGDLLFQIKLFSDESGPLHVDLTLSFKNIVLDLTTHDHVNDSLVEVLVEELHVLVLESLNRVEVLLENKLLLLVIVVEQMLLLSIH